MSDIDNNDDDLSRFAVEEDDVIKPIDVASSTPDGSPSSQEAPQALSPDSADNLSQNPLPAASEEEEESEILFIQKGEYIDITEKSPELKRILIGAGWENRSMADAQVDVDLSLFMLDKKDMTRIDEDFIFYNNDRAFDGAVHHMGDKRHGSSGLDNENIFIDLNGVSFDILKIVFVLSIYDPEIKGDHFGMTKNIYIRIMNKDDQKEIFRYKLAEEDCARGNAIVIGTLIREGPKWIYEASADIQNGGLAKIATEYGIIVKELQSSGGDHGLPE